MKTSQSIRPNRFMNKKSNQFIITQLWKKDIPLNILFAIIPIFLFILLNNLFNVGERISVFVKDLLALHYILKPLQQLASIGAFLFALFVVAIVQTQLKTKHKRVLITIRNITLRFSPTSFSEILEHNSNDAVRNKIQQFVLILDEGSWKAGSLTVHTKEGKELSTVYIPQIRNPWTGELYFLPANNISEFPAPVESNLNGRKTTLTCTRNLLEQNWNEN
jgi:hypothetical protein